MHGGNDVDREDVSVDEVRLCLELLNDLEIGESPRVPGLVPVRVELSCALVGSEDVVVVLKKEGRGESATKRRKRRKGEKDVRTHRRRPSLSKRDLPLSLFEVASREKLTEL